MKSKKSIFSRFYVLLCLAFFYLPILVTMIFSFNSSKSLTRFTGFFSSLVRRAVKECRGKQSSLRIRYSCHPCNGDFYSAWNHNSYRSFQVKESGKGAAFKYKQHSDSESGDCDSHRSDAAVFLTGLQKRIYDNASGAYCFLYALCDHKRIPESKRT